MRIRTLISIMILVLAVLIINSCVTTPKTQEKESVNQEIFFQAVRSGDYNEVKRLIGVGADVNAQDNFGETALMKATYYEHQEVAQLLIENGADVNIQENSGATALFFATERGYLEVAILLIENGADVNIQDNIGSTALTWALTGGHEEIAKLLREAGAKE